MESSSEPRRRTAGVVIIGNEILGGKIEEKNAVFFMKRFRALGVRLREVAIVEDDRPAIAQAVARVSSSCDVVCTSGGVGPTHDDVTVDGIARAFGLPVVESAEIVATMARLLGREATASHRRMARVPEGAELLCDGATGWPTIKVRNVYVFPGIPWLLRKRFSDLESRFASDTPLLGAAFSLSAQETDICEALDAIVAQHPAVEFGSYPSYDGGRWTVRLILEGCSAACVDAARDAVRGAFSDLVEGEDPTVVLTGPAAPAGAAPD